MSRSTRKSLVAALTLSAPALLAWEFVPIPVKLWSGSFDLIVRVECQSGQPRMVSCGAFANHDEAAQILSAVLRHKTETFENATDQFDSGLITVRVRSTGRDSPLGRELARAQFRYLVVVAELPDGRRVGTLAEIPDGRVCRELTVTLP